MSLISLLDKSATIERNTATIGDTGKVSVGWATVATGVPCAIQPKSVRSSGEEFGEGLSSTHVGYFLPSADIEPESSDGKADRVTVDSVKYLCRGVRDAAGKTRLQIVALERQA